MGKGDGLASGILDAKSTHQEIETQVEKGLEKENQIIEGGKEEGFKNFGDHSKMDLPAVVDICPICFDSFTIPCRTNCGHWYCANCILSFWDFRSSIRPCKCPLCSCRITNLASIGSQRTGPKEDVVVVTRRVWQYNSLYAGGICGIFLKVLALPLIVRRMFGIVMEPCHFRWIYYLLRFLGILLSLLYDVGDFEFIPTGALGIHRMFSVGTSVLVVIFLLVSIRRKWTARRRARRLAVLGAGQAYGQPGIAQGG